MSTHRKESKRIKDARKARLAFRRSESDFREASGKAGDGGDRAARFDRAFEKILTRETEKVAKFISDGAGFPDAPTSDKAAFWAFEALRESLSAAKVLTGAEKAGLMLEETAHLLDATRILAWQAVCLAERAGENG